MDEKKGNGETHTEKNSSRVWLCGVLTSSWSGELELNLIAVAVCLVENTRKRSFNICGEVNRMLRHDKWTV